MPISAGDLGAVGRQAGLLEQVGAVADALGADVGAVADQLAVGVGAGLGLPVEPAAVDLGVGEVDERVGLGQDRAASQSPSIASMSERPEPAASLV